MYRITYGDSLGKFHGYFLTPEHHGKFEVVRDSFGDPALFDTPQEAEATAGHVLCTHLQKGQGNGTA